MTSTNPFSEIENRLKKLESQFEADNNYDEFEKEIQTLTLTFNDETWQLGVAGKWSKLVKGEWIPTAPPTEENIATVLAAEEEDASVEPEESEPTNFDTAEAESSEDEPLSETSVKKTPSHILIISGAIAILLLCFFGGWIWLNQSHSATPTPVAQTDIAKALPPTTNTPTKTAAPSVPPTPTETSAPINVSPTDAPTPLPSDTPTSTLTPTEPPTPLPNTPTPFSSTPTSVSMPSPSPTPVQPEPSPTSDTFSPAGLLAYPVFDPQWETYDVYVTKLETGKTVRVIKNASQPDLSPNGQQIVYRSWQSDRRGLVVEDLQDGGNAWLSSNLFEASRPIWNAKGNDIVFAVNNIAPEKWNISFSGDRRGFSDGKTPAWFQDGRIIYQGSIGIDNGLIVTDPNQGGPVFLTHSTQDTAPAPSPDGSKVAFISNRDGDWDLYLVEVATKKVKRLTNDPALDTSPTWSPDGTRIAFASTRGGSWAVWSITPEGADEQQILDIPGPFEGKVADAPDAQQTSWQTEHISWVP